MEQMPALKARSPALSPDSTFIREIVGPVPVPQLLASLSRRAGVVPDARVHGRAAAPGSLPEYRDVTDLHLLLIYKIDLGITTDYYVVC